MTNFRLKIITPAGTTVDTDVASALLPTQAGEVEVLGGHCKYVGLLASGIVKFKPVNVSSITSTEIKVGEGSVAYEEGTLKVLSES